jgi:hypothetical protein
LIHSFETSERLKVLKSSTEAEHFFRLAQHYRPHRFGADPISAGCSNPGADLSYSRASGSLRPSRSRISMLIPGILCRKARSSETYFERSLRVHRELLSSVSLLASSGDNQGNIYVFAFTRARLHRRFSFGIEVPCVIPESKYRSAKVLFVAQRTQTLGRTIPTVLCPFNIFLAQSAFLRVWPYRHMHPSSGALASQSFYEESFCRG